MSSIKLPVQKKKLSLERDRRNTYGENAKASRKSIPKGKQTSNQSERRAANAPLAKAKGVLSEDMADEVELDSRTVQIEKRRKGFKKSPDQPLGLVIEQKQKSAYTSWKAFGNLEYMKARGII
ncbi:MAG: hypothetical protein ABR905_08800 [Terracidiphilus sp.]|jgi:hypothetical protein